MTAQSNIDGVFEEENTEVKETKLVEPAGNENKADDTESEEPKGDNTEPPSDENMTVEELRKQRDAFKTMALDEKTKRQELSKQLTQRAMPDPETDPEDYARFMVETRVNQSRELLMSMDGYDDFEDMEKHFLGMVQANPALRVQLSQNVNPALFAYQKAKEDKEIQKLKDPDYLKKREEELREKIRADLLKEMGTPDKKSTPQVPDLTKAAAVGKNTNPIEEDIETIDEIFAA